MIKKKGLNNNGFSLLELVIAIGILLILSVGGLLAYNGIVNDNRRAAMEVAASVALNNVFENVIDFDDNTTATSAVNEWNTVDNNGFIASYEIEDNCINVILTDSKGKVDPVKRSKDQLCNVDAVDL